MKRWLVSVWLVLMALVLVFTASCGPGEEGRTYKLGFIGPLTGPAAPWFLPFMGGAEMAVDEINEQGGIVIGGQRYALQIVVADDKVQPEESVTAVQKLIFDEKVEYIFGPIGTSCAMAVRPITEENHVVLFAATTAGPSFPLGPEYPYTFAFLSAPQFIADAGYQWLAENHPAVKRVALISGHTTSGEEAQELASNAAEARGMEVVARELFEMGATDFTPFVTRMLAREPDLIDTTPSTPSSCALIVKQAREMGYAGLLFSCTPPEAAVLRVAAGVEYAEGFIGVSFAVWEKGTAEERAFYQRFVERYGKELWSDVAAGGYFWVHWMVQVFEEVDSFDVDVVVPAMEESKLEMFGYTYRWTGEEEWGIPHERWGSHYFVRIFQDGEWEPVATIEMEW